MVEESNLEKLKKDYQIFYKKYSLPSFEDLNKDFNIEKIAEDETEFLLREVRKFIADKFMTYLRFIESLLNPTNVPMFIFSIIKTLGPEDKIKLTNTYKKLAKCEIDLIGLDLEFSEEEEAKFISDSYKEWQEIKEIILEILEIIKKNWNHKSKTNDKGYFG